MVLLVKSTKDDKAIPYHDKVIKSYYKIIQSIIPELIQANPILSGSAAITLVYAPKAPYGDLDLYFQSQEDFDLALQIVKSKVLCEEDEIYDDSTSAPRDYDKIYTYYYTKNAVTINTNRFKLQLIRKEFLTPEKLIYSHDFTNVSVAVTKDAIYTTKETLFSWYEKQIVLRNYMLSENANITDRMSFYATFLGRVNKYVSRYDLKMSNPLHYKIKQIHTDLCSPELDNNNLDIDHLILVTDHYYGGLSKENFINKLKVELLRITDRLISHHELIQEIISNEDNVF